MVTSDQRDLALKMYADPDIHINKILKATHLNVNGLHNLLDELNVPRRNSPDFQARPYIDPNDPDYTLDYTVDGLTPLDSPEESTERDSVSWDALYIYEVDYIEVHKTRIRANSVQEVIDSFKPENQKFKIERNIRITSIREL